MTPAGLEELIARANNYLGTGGFFNPELMDPAKVRDLVLDLREVALSALRAIRETTTDDQHDDDLSRRP